MGDGTGAALAVVVMGRQLRALENLVHEAAHYNWSRRNRRANDALAVLLTAIPTGAVLSGYRTSHLLHHGRFGLGEDPDRQRYEELNIDRTRFTEFAAAISARFIRYQRGWLASLGESPFMVAAPLGWAVATVTFPALALGGAPAAVLATSLWLDPTTGVPSAWRRISHGAPHVAGRAAPPDSAAAPHAARFGSGIRGQTAFSHPCAERSAPRAGRAVMPAIGRVDAVTTVALTDELCAIFPDVYIAIIAASGVRGNEPWPRVVSSLAELERQAAGGQWVPAGEDDVHISSWHEAYRRFGTNPRRQRPSMEALCRRLGRTGRLPRISSTVDCYNLVSVRHVVPAGAFDREAVVGDVTIAVARGDERFVPLGEPDTAETARAGEVVYVDAEGVLTRHWNHRDADRTKVTADSREVMFQLEAVTTRLASAVDEAAAELAGHVREHADDVRVHVLSAGNRTVTLPRPELTRER